MCNTSREVIMAGPNQTGQVLQSPLSAQLGFGNALLDQAKDDSEEKRKKALMDAANGTPPPQPAPALSQYLGF
jgi:hypothetical protein